MKPGRELDALVAEKVMGLKVYRKSEDFFVDDGLGSEDSLVPEFSEDISSAWTVVEKTGLLKSQQLFQQSSGKWIIGNLDTQDGLLILCAEAETASAVICLAALKAVGVEI